MENSVFNSNTYGIGELITQKKRLEVPLHQRSFSWGSTEVEQFLEDIFTAIDDNYANYFLGSLVMTKPIEGIWGILDGQQRLTTVSIIYSCIRMFLLQNNKNNDAEQISSEFLGVRSLGGEYRNRLLLNGENRDVYTEAVVGFCSDSKLELLEVANRKSASNLLLLNAIKLCRNRIYLWSFENFNLEEAIRRLYQLSSYLETKALVVSIEVADESDAFMVFETLNTRGQDLSALDLVKNYIFGSTDKSKHEEISAYWSAMKANIAERQADDFLRIFWMGNYGLIQKSRLYTSLKTKFSGEADTYNLAQILCGGSEIYAAIEEPKHPFWQNYSQFSRHLVEILRLLKSKQTRPILFACAKAKDISSPVMDDVLWFLTVLTIRFQTIGKRRQGILEKHCAMIAHNVSQKHSVDRAFIRQEIKRILPNDAEFYQDFKKYQEVNMKRALYFLGAIEISKQTKSTSYFSNFRRIEKLIDAESNVSVSHIFPLKANSNWKKLFNEDELENLDLTTNLANFMLVDSGFNFNSKDLGFAYMQSELAKSKLITTAQLSTIDSWNRVAFDHRKSELADVAVKLWAL